MVRGHKIVVIKMMLHVEHKQNILCYIKEFCIQASESFPMLEFVLDSFEEGYMCVDVLQDDAKIAELHVTDIAQKELSLFSFVQEDKDVRVFNQFSKGVSFISKLVS